MLESASFYFLGTKSIMKTPCIAACKNNGGLCSGCHRTIDEIINWRHLDDEKRENIIATISGTETTHPCPECNENTHCDIAAGKSTCWCFNVEKREVEKPNDLCLCRKCLDNKAIL